MPKPTRTAKQLQAILRERIDAIPELAGQPVDSDVVGVKWVPGGTGGNWTVPVLRNRDQHRVDVARVIRQVQAEFDLDVD